MIIELLTTSTYPLAWYVLGNCCLALFAASSAKDPLPTLFSHSPDISNVLYADSGISWTERKAVEAGESFITSTALDTICGSLSGVVGRRCTNKSGTCPSCDCNQFSACLKKSRSVDISAEISVGRRNGTSAPNSRAIRAYSSESVDTRTLSIFGERSATRILKAINGRPANGLIFLSVTPFEPERAGTIATTFI